MWKGRGPRGNRTCPVQSYFPSIPKNDISRESLEDLLGFFRRTEVVKRQ